MRETTLRMPVGVVEALKTRAATDGVSQANVLFDAITTVRDGLPSLVREVTQERTSHDGVFMRTTPPVSVPMETHALRTYAANITELDRIVLEAGAPSRSLLCAVALRQYLL